MNHIKSNPAALKGYELLKAFQTDIENIFRYQPFLIKDCAEFPINEYITIQNLKVKTIRRDQEGLSPEAVKFVDELLASFRQKTIDKALKALYFKFEEKDYVILCLTEDNAVVSTRFYQKEHLVNLAKLFNC